VAHGGHLVHLGDKSPGATNTQRLSMKCFALRSSGSLKGCLKSLLGGLDLSEARRRESLSSRSFGSYYFQVNGVANGVRGWRPPFIPPKGNLPVEVSEIHTCPAKRPDMSEKCYWNPVLALDKSGAGT
jgi:hypothetical protein